MIREVKEETKGWMFQDKTKKTKVGHRTTRTKPGIISLQCLSMPFTTWNIEHAVRSDGMIYGN